MDDYVPVEEIVIGDQMDCIVCGINIEYFCFDPEKPEGPGGKDPVMKATEFRGGGHYGSAVTDDECLYFINICDECIKRALQIGTCFRRIRKS